MPIDANERATFTIADDGNTSDAASPAPTPPAPVLTAVVPTTAPPTAHVIRRSISIIIEKKCGKPEILFQANVDGQPVPIGKPVILKRDTKESIPIPPLESKDLALFKDGKIYICLSKGVISIDVTGICINLKDPKSKPYIFRGLISFKPK